MPKKTRPQWRIFTGWWSVLFIGIVSGLGHGFNIYGFSVIFKQISAELELNRAFTSLAAGMGRLEGGITSPLVGWLSDKFGPRWIVIIGTAIAGAGMVLMSRITEVWQYYVCWGVLIGLGLNIGLTVTCDKMINDWFIKRRGLAQGIKFAIISIFGIIILPIVTGLVEFRDWRFACLVFGIILFISLPLAYIFIKPYRPEYYGLLPDGAVVDTGASRDLNKMIETGVDYAAGVQETEYTFKQAIRTSTYWLLVIGFMVHNFIAGGFNVHVYPFLTDIGIAEAAASGMMSLMVFFTIPSRFFGGILADKVPRSRIHLLLVASFLLQVIGIGSYLWSRSLFSVYIYLACHGLSSGAVTPIIVLIIGRYFGRKAFGSILGMMIAFLAPMSLLSPVYYGWVFDVFSNYDAAFITALILAAVAVVVTLFVRPPRPTGDKLNAGMT